MDSRAALLLTAILLGIGASVSTLEWLAIRPQLAAGGLLSFDVLGSRRPLAGPGLRAALFRRALGYRTFCLILVARLIALVALPPVIAVDARAPVVGLLAVVLISGFLLHARSPYGLDGSDQMTTQIYAAVFLALLVGGWGALGVALWYVAAQSALSYFTSGTAKLISPMWRRGEVSYRVFNTRSYGYEPVARFLRERPGMSRALDRTVIAAEMSFPLCLLVGYPVVLAFLTWGILFHLVNAAVMGLNSFFWAFIATYPAVLYVATTITLRLGRAV